MRKYRNLHKVILLTQKLPSIDKQMDGYVICYTYGDFYSHEATRGSRGGKV